MSIDLTSHKDSLLFLPLGGCNEIGMNVNLYHYKGKWLMVDCGAGFAEDSVPGVDMLVADLDFIQRRKKDLLGLVLTHAHEDHIGGVQYLFQNMNCPVFATPFTANFLRLRLKEYDPGNKIKIHELKQSSAIDLEPFSISMLPLTHSAPEMQGLMIRTSAGNIFHTGDWKFDGKPVVGEPSDEALLKKYGEEGITALVCDSTNVFCEGTSGFEGDLKDSLIKIVKDCSGLVVVTTFASNLSRLEALVIAAKQANRKVMLAGKSLLRVTQAARESGYFADAEPFLDMSAFRHHERENILVISTGCQGEPLAAVSKMATGTHPHIKLMKGDTVIFSSKIIPGNEKRISRLFNTFVRSKVEVITERDHFVHVSGHPSIDELKRMYELTKPKMCIPVHGEPIHIHEHAKLAKAAGIKHVVEVENGLLVKINPSNSEILGKVKSGYLAVEGNYLLPTDSEIFKQRRKLQGSGVIVVTLVLYKGSKLLTKPIISFSGCLDYSEDAEFISELKNELSEEINACNANNYNHKGMKSYQIEKMVKGVVRRMVKKEIGKDPIVVVTVERVSNFNN